MRCSDDSVQQNRCLTGLSLCSIRQGALLSTSIGWSQLPNGIYYKGCTQGALPIGSLEDTCPTIILLTLTTLLIFWKQSLGVISFRGKSVFPLLSLKCPVVNYVQFELQLVYLILTNVSLFFLALGAISGPWKSITNIQKMLMGLCCILNLLLSVLNVKFCWLGYVTSDSHAPRSLSSTALDNDLRTQELYSKLLGKRM